MRMLIIGALVAVALAVASLTQTQTAPTQSSEGDMIDSSSTSASANVQLTLTIASLPNNLVAGSSIELYLEDDFQVPDSIDRDTVYFRVTGPLTPATNNGGLVYAVDPIEIDDDDHYGGDDDWSIRVFIPDMNTGDNFEGFNGPAMGQTLVLVFTQAAGIKNPSEQGTHSVGYSVLGPNDRPNNGPQVQLGTVPTYAKIALSDEDNRRGYELTVFGSGFNNGTSAAVYVLHKAGADPGDRTTWPSCAEVITQGARAGIATVGSDDRVAVTFEVTVPPFRAGKNNYICMVDGEGRSSSTDVEQFELQDSLRVAPTSVAVGDTVTVFAQDFPNTGAALTELKIAGQVVYPASAAGANAIDVQATSIGIGIDHSATATFTMPSEISGVSLIGIGTIRIDAKWGTVSEDTKITVTDTPSSPPAVVVTDNVPPATNIRVCSGPNAGEVVISWDRVSHATYYRIGYVNMVKDYPRAKASVTGEWIEAFIYVDVNARNLPVRGDGRVQYILRRLVTDDRHAFTVLTSKDVVNTAEMVSGAYRWPQNPRWQFLTVADPEPGCR